MLEMVSVEHGRVIPSPLSNFLFNQGFLCSLPSTRIADSSEWTCTILRRLPHITFGSQRLGWSLWRCRFVWRPRPFWASWMLVCCSCIADCTFHIAILGIALFIHFIAQISKGLDILPYKSDCHIITILIFRILLLFSLIWDTTKVNRGLMFYLSICWRLLDSRASSFTKSRSTRKRPQGPLNHLWRFSPLIPWPKEKGRVTACVPA